MSGEAIYAVTQGRTVIHREKKLTSDRLGTAEKGEEIELGRIARKKPKWIHAALPDGTSGWAYGKTTGEKGAVEFIPRGHCAVAQAKMLVYKTTSLTSSIVGCADEGVEFILGSARDGEGTQWITATLPDGAAGYVFGRTNDEKGYTEFIPKPAHYMSRHIKVGIVHQSTSDYKTSTPLLTLGTTKTWKLFRSPPIVIETDRPEDGAARVNMTCPYCGKKIEGVFWGRSKYMKKRKPFSKKGKRKVAFGLILSLIVILGLNVWCFHTYRGGDATALILVLLLLLAWFFCFLVLMSAEEIDNTPENEMGGRVYVEEKEIRNGPVDDQYDGHYIAWFESK